MHNDIRYTYNKYVFYYLFLNLFLGNKNRFSKKSLLKVCQSLRLLS